MFPVSGRLHRGPHARSPPSRSRLRPSRPRRPRASGRTTTPRRLAVGGTVSWRNCWPFVLLTSASKQSPAPKGIPLGAGRYHPFSSSPKGEDPLSALTGVPARAYCPFRRFRPEGSGTSSESRERRIRSYLRLSGAPVDSYCFPSPPLLSEVSLLAPIRDVNKGNP